MAFYTSMHLCQVLGVYYNIDPVFWSPFIWAGHLSGM